MLINKTGDILNAEENIICHQVNKDGIMGGGLALQIAKSYPNVENEYKKFCRSYDYSYEKLRGLYKNIKCNENQYIANCFTQKENFETDYKALKVCFSSLLSLCKKTNKTIAIPYKYGCGIANGDWEEVKTILINLSGIYGVDISVYKLEK